MEYFTHTLENGIRLIHQQSSSPVAYCGVIVNTGSRDEEEEEHGLAHFLEHMIFKGTERRKSHYILSCMEDVGGELNAYTTKEETCLHTAFYGDYYNRAFELMADLMFNSVMPVKEIDKEKEVIIDEINSYKDSPVEQLFDDFEEQVFNTNAIARNILGAESSLKSYTRDQLLTFYRNNYPTTEMVVSSVGNLPFKRVCACFEKNFSRFPHRERNNPRPVYNDSTYQTHTKRIDQKTYQAHCILGNQAYSNHNDKRVPLHLLTNLLAGTGMNSRLNISLRERRGLAYNVESNYTTYTDTGLVSIYFGTDREDLDRCISITLKELKKLREQALGRFQLSRAKKQLIGQLAISAESSEHQMINNGRSLLLFNKVDSFEEITRKVEAVTPDDILSVANEIFSPELLSYRILY